MSFPFDQWTALAQANRTLAIRWTEILREAGERQVEIAARSLGSLTAGTPEGQAPALPDLSGIFKEVEDNRQHALAQTQAAIEQWRADSTDIVSADAARDQMANLLQTWASPFAAPWTAATGSKAKAPA